MEAFMPVSIIVVALLALLYLRFYFKRLRLFLSLKKAAKRVGSKIILTTGKFWLPTNRCKQSELLIIGSDFVYSVKVIGLFQKFCDLHFWNPREYATRKYLLKFQIDQSTPLGSKDARHKRLDVDFAVGLPENASNKPMFRFYLLSPANSPIHLTKNDGNQIVDLEPGGKIDDIIFADREYLYQYILWALHERVTKG